MMIKELMVKLESLKEGENYIVPEGDYGRAEVYKINDHYIIFEIPLYGGEPVFWGATKWAEEAAKSCLYEMN